MRNFLEPFRLIVVVGAIACSLTGCDLFQPERHFSCWKPDCKPVECLKDSDCVSTGAHCVAHACNPPNPHDGGAGAEAAVGSGGSGTAGMAGTIDSGASGGGEGGHGGESGGGAGGSSADAGLCGSCPSDKPVCFEGACVGCARDMDCAQGDKARCDDATHACVECVAKGDCHPPTPACAENRCVGCVGDTDCAAPTPACDTAKNSCVGCTRNEHCGGTTPLCDPTAKACVACLSERDCSSATGSHCNAGKCEPCSEDSQCSHLDHLGVCDTSSGNGKCVECTGQKYSACGTAPSGKAHVCDSKAKACTTKEATTALACEPCVSDAHCFSGMACMQTTFGPSDTDTGNFCLWKRDAAGAVSPNGDCLNVRPYVGTESGWKSVDGDGAAVCKPRSTTCQGQSDFSAKSCSGTTPAGDAECGAVSVDDAYCAPFGGQFRCTVPCVSYDDCQPTQQGANMECQQQTLGTATEKVCQFQ